MLVGGSAGVPVVLHLVPYLMARCDGVVGLGCGVGVSPRWGSQQMGYPGAEVVPGWGAVAVPGWGWGVVAGAQGGGELSAARRWCRWHTPGGALLARGWGG